MLNTLLYCVSLVWIVDLYINIQYLPTYAQEDPELVGLRKETGLTIEWPLEQEAFISTLQFAHLFSKASPPFSVSREQQLFFRSTLSDAFP